MCIGNELVSDDDTNQILIGERYVRDFIVVYLHNGLKRDYTFSGGNKLSVSYLAVI